MNGIINGALDRSTLSQTKIPKIGNANSNDSSFVKSSETEPQQLPAGVDPEDVIEDSKSEETDGKKEEKSYETEQIHIVDLCTPDFSTSDECNLNSKNTHKAPRFVSDQFSFDYFRHPSVAPPSPNEDRLRHPLLNGPLGVKKKNNFTFFFF